MIFIVFVYDYKIKIAYSQKSEPSVSREILNYTVRKLIFDIMKHITWLGQNNDRLELIFPSILQGIL
jgi:hypothetical protein